MYFAYHSSAVFAAPRHPFPTHSSKVEHGQGATAHPVSKLAGGQRVIGPSDVLPVNLSIMFLAVLGFGIEAFGGFNLAVCGNAAKRPTGVEGKPL